MQGVNHYLWNGRRKDGGGRGGGGSAAVPPPPTQTPHDPMEYLSKSWRLSSAEISKAIIGSGRKKKNYVMDQFPNLMGLADTLALAVPLQPALQDKPAITPRTTGRRWFRSTKAKKTGENKKEKARADRAEIHVAISLAGVAAAVAAMASRSQSSEIPLSAMKAATELLASHFIEVARRSGANSASLSSTVQSAVDINTPGDLMTLTAAAATALRASATLKSRLRREGGLSYAAVIPYSCNPDVFCKEGNLLKRTRTGALHWKQVTVYINKSSQVILKMKSKHMGGAFSKTKCSVVYGVYEDIPAWPGRGKGLHFGLSTSVRILEFECENEIQKQKWVDGVGNLLNQASKEPHELQRSLKQLKLR